jgi:excisionase family DNA binding protein
MTDASQQRFLKLTDVQEILQISSAQAYALVRSGKLPAIRVGGRHQWRVERAKLEAFLEESYGRTAEAIAAGLSFETGQEHEAEGDAEEPDQLG